VSLRFGPGKVNIAITAIIEMAAVAALITVIILGL
jgi:hypothetical protein